MTAPCVREAHPLERSAKRYRTWGSGLDRPTAQDTMREMRRLVRASLMRRPVIETPRMIIRGVPERQELAQARAIRAWCDSRFRFVRDPVGVEYLIAPSRQLAEVRRWGFVQGDCDDAAMMTAALCMSVGLPCRFYAVARNAQDVYRHVFAVAYPLDRASGRRVAVELDITRPSEIPTLPAFGRRLPMDV